MQRKWMTFLVAIALATVCSAGAQALSIEVDGARKARATTSDDGLIYKGKKNRSRGIFRVMMDSDGTADVVMKRRGKRTKRYTMALDEGEHTFVYKRRRAVRMHFHEDDVSPPNVPEPTTFALLGAALAGLALRRRQN